MAANANYATWNRLANVNPGLSYAAFICDKGNIRWRGNTGGSSTSTSTISMPSGKWYIEMYAENSSAGGWPTVGILKTENISNLQDVSNYQSYSSSTASMRSEVSATSGKIYKFGATSSVTGGSTFTDGDVIQFAIDIDGGKWYFGKNGTYSNSSVPASGSNPIDTFTAGTEMSIWVSSYNGTSYMYINAGQDSTFSGNVSAGTGVDDNGFGNFKYSPPTGFLALCSANMPTGSGIDPAESSGDDDNPTKQFNVVTYTGNAGSNAITGLGFKPDFCWIKITNSTGGAALVNSTVGGQKVVQSNSNSAEGSSSPFQTFDADGFTLDGTSSYLGNFNGSSDTYVAWCWRANGGTTVSNSQGSITSTVQANQAAGFSICTYTGTGSAGTFGHGLGAVPRWVMIKNRSTGSKNWACYHVDDNENGTRSIILNSGAVDTSNYWNGTQPTSTVFSIRTETEVNASGDNHVAYLWADVEGMQKFGTYTGNGDSDGAFVHLGFRPALLTLKRTTSSGFFNVFYSPPKTFNSSANAYLTWNTTDSEASGVNIDFTSNGFKVKNTGSGVNSSGTKYIYMAWGDVPFKYSNPF